MRYKLYTTILILLIIFVGVGAASGLQWQLTAGASALMLITTALLLHAVHKPLHAVESGIYLLKEQDFASRLRKTGQPDADKIVALYNNLMESMKQERLKLSEQNRFLSLLVEASPQGIAICDFAGVIMDTNRAWDKMMSPALSKAIEDVKEGDIRTVRFADGLIVRISRLWFMDSGFRRRFVLVERLTEEIAAAEKQMFNKIVRTIGHEVNNTLGSVISLLDTIGDIHADDPLITDAVNGSCRSCANLVNFVRGYADIVKLPPLSQEKVNIHHWLSDILPTLAALAQKNVTVDIATPEKLVTGLPEVMMDPILMERVIINIVKNAVESIGDREDGHIVIDVCKSAGRDASLLLTVTDNGPGIDPDTEGQLFTPFFSTKHPDRGLGLMLIADILHSHGFSFSLATDPTTRLTTFSIGI